MPRTSQGEGGRPDTINLYAVHRHQLLAMTAKTGKNKSVLIRELIEKEYKTMFKDTREELEIQKKNLETVIASLESLKGKEDELKKIWIDKYLDSKKKLGPRSPEEYVRFRKLWIKNGIEKDNLGDAFPNMSVDEVFSKMEEEVKARQ